MFQIDSREDPKPSKGLAPQGSLAPNLLVDVHVLQESEHWAGILYRGANLAHCEEGVVLSAKQTSSPYVSII